MKSFLLKIILFLVMVGTMPSAVCAQPSAHRGKLAVVGDSYVENHKRPYTETWHCMMAERLGLDYQNVGKNGSSVAFDRTKEWCGQSLLQRYRQIDKDADYVLIIAGHNDADKCKNNRDSLRMFSDSLRALITGIRQRCPKARLGYVSPWNNERVGFKQVGKIIRKVCKDMNVPLLDNYQKNCPIHVRDDAFRARYFQAVRDWAHLNADGHRLYLPYGERWFLDNVAPELKHSFRIASASEVKVWMNPKHDPVAQTALDMLDGDLHAVLSARIITTGEKDSALITVDFDRSLPWEGFSMKVSDGKLRITAADSHGMAYALLQLSRLMGVSPWEWWADATPAKRAGFALPEGYADKQQPSVPFRGIFINDEDWGLNPWAYKTYEPGLGKGVIGPKTTARIFELMLRLRANAYWPPMHEVSVPFFLTKGNREVALKYGIYVGGSHCEPMACSTAGEWPRRGKGDYDFVHNRQGVINFWEDRMKEVGKQPILYTIGMRGVHDGAMNGAKTVQEQKVVLDSVFKVQRQMLRKYVNEDITKVPQVFVPYKEVLNVYNAGLKVPDDVTLMWCDDNYGYIRHFPTAEERARKGGNAIYYHVSYYGKPHDYLWLGTSSPAQLQQQMNLAYDRGIQHEWILNVGDIKPDEYLTELFLDMAWDIDSVRRLGVRGHLDQFLKREFGQKQGGELTDVMSEFYRLAYERKPEHMGGTRTLEWPVGDWETVKGLGWSESHMRSRLAKYNALSDKVEKMFTSVPNQKKDEFYQLVKYPVQGATQMNRKLIVGELARHGLAKWSESDAAYDSIAVMTRRYNEGFFNHGKWNCIMDMRPRELAVFQRLKHNTVTTPLPTDTIPLAFFNATDAVNGNLTPCEMLGYDGKAATLAKGSTATYQFKANATGVARVVLHMYPNHPVEGDKLRVRVSLDGGPSVVVDYAAVVGTNEWKDNVERNQALRTLLMRLGSQASHTLTVEALDEGVVIDQIAVYEK